MCRESYAHSYSKTNTDSIAESNPACKLWEGDPSLFCRHKGEEMP